MATTVDAATGAGVLTSTLCSSPATATEQTKTAAAAKMKLFITILHGFKSTEPFH
jgi:hypothetical protein